MSRSRTFAVLIENGDHFEIKFYCRVTNHDMGEKIMEETPHSLAFQAANRDEIRNLLADGGITVRFYDPGEKNWLDYSLEYGLIGAPGSRDGTFGVPDLETFEERFLSNI